MNKVLNTNSQNSQSSLTLVQSGEIYRKNGEGSVSPLVNHKERCRENPKKTINEVTLNRQLVQSKDTAPRIQVSVEFAAKQLFQILLIDIKYRNAKLHNQLEPIPSAI